MKLFEGKNYYQILKIAPDAAIGTIHRAYREALALYDEDALATYAMFSEEQRRFVLQTISEAYDTLSDENKRIEILRRRLAGGPGRHAGPENRGPR